MSVSLPRIWLLLLAILFSVPKIIYGQCSTGGNQDGGLGNGGENLPQWIKSLIEWRIAAVYALDPNDITGPKGFAEKQWVSVKDKMGFTIRYENDPEFASAPAQNVVIHLPVDPRIDINSFRLGGFGFGRYNFNVPENTSYYNTRLNLQDSLGIFVDVTSGIDIVKNEVFWILRSIDPLTGIAPIDALQGFLPVNDTIANPLADSLPGKGEGYVNFFFSPKPDVATGDSVSATAKIVFDVNEEIPTNIWTNTIDAVAPASKINNYGVTNNVITLKWAGQDDANGTGVRDYALYVSEEGGAFKLYQNKITASTITYTGTPGNKYCFFTLATDNTGNQEALKKTCELGVELNGINIPLPVTWLYFTGTQQDNNVLLNWATTAEKNAKEFVIERSFNGRQFIAVGTVQAKGLENQTANYSYLDTDAMLLESNYLYYRLKQVDKDGKFIYSVIVSIPVKQAWAKASVKAYPNPFAHQLILRIQNVKPTDQTDKVQLYTSDGRLVYQRKLAQRGPATILLQDLPNLKPGIYILHAVIAKKLYSIKLTRQ